MSLKAFHVAFIFLSTALCAGFALWCFREMTRTDNTAYGIAGAVSAAGVIALAVYSFRFLQKSRSVGYL
jgi:hypothetical protein